MTGDGKLGGRGAFPYNVTADSTRTVEMLRAVDGRSIANPDYCAQLENGAGLLADVALRELQRNFQARFSELGTKGMPMSHRLGHAFFQRPDETSSPYLLYPERDFLVSFNDFVDFATAPDAPALTEGAAYELTNRVIYNVTATEEIPDLLLESSKDVACGFRAASMLRLDDSLVMYISSAERVSAATIADINTRFHDEWNVNPATRATLKRSAEFRRKQYGERRIVYLDGTDLMPTMAQIRFDLKSRRVVGRCLLRDIGDKYDTYVDMLDAFRPDADPSIIEGFVSRLDACSTLWEMAKMLTHLPTYLASRVGHVEEQEVETAFSRLPAAKRKQYASAQEHQRIRYRTIAAVAPLAKADSLKEIASDLTGRNITLPQFQIPIDGFWRQLSSIDSIGKDPEGLPIKGQTWVRAHVRFKDRPAPTEIKTVYIKASLSTARQRLEAYRRRMVKQVTVPVPAQLDSVFPVAPSLPAPPVSEGQHGAYVYVMRCHAHTEDLFKVGFTDRDPDSRAKELSASTSAPSPFVVVRAWAVTDGRAAEKAAHDALAPMRLNANREFFTSPYAQLQDVLESAVASWVL